MKKTKRLILKSADGKSKIRISKSNIMYDIMKEQEPKSRAQFLEERVANSCLNYQSKHGFDTAFDLILEDVIELRKMVNSVSGETPKPDQPIEDAKSMLKRFRDKHFSDSGSMSGSFNGLDRIPFVVDNAIIELMTCYAAQFEKLSGEAKTPDAEKIVAMYRLENHPNALRAIIYALELTGGSVPTPSDEEKIDVRIGMQLFLRKYKTGEEETAFIQGVRFGRGSAEQEKKQKS